MTSQKNGISFLVLRNVGPDSYRDVGQNQMCQFMRLAFLVDVCRFARSFYNEAQRLAMHCGGIKDAYSAAKDKDSKIQEFFNYLQNRHCA